MTQPDVRADPGAMTARGRARIALGMVLRRIAEHARALIPTYGDSELRPGELIRAVRTLRAYDLTPLELAVAVELMDGATWAQIAAALGLPQADARARYGEKAARWAAGEPAPPGPVLPGGALPAGLPPTPDRVGWAAAAELEAWYQRTADPDDPVTRPGPPWGGPARPVTGELE